MGADEISASAAEAPSRPPVLDELPRLASVLGGLRTADDAMLAAVAELADLLASDEVERTTGVGVDHWLAAVAVQTRLDRRLLVRTGRLLHRLPSLDDAVRRRRISFAQLRGVVLALQRAPAELDAKVDDLLASLLDGLERFERPDPDVLARQLSDALDELDPDDLAVRERDAATGRYLALQPFLDGTGGRFNGAFDAAGMALLDAASTPPAAIDHPDGYGAARADALLARLAGDAPDGDLRAASGTVGGGSVTTPPDGDESGTTRPHGDENGTTRPDGTAPAAPTGPSAGAERPDVTPWWERLAAPTLLIRLPFEALLDDRIPADLLTTLVGGRLRLTAPAARRLLEGRGAQLRAVVVDDDGAVLGVGRSTRQPPGWLRDVLAVLHDTCTGPGCDRSARAGQVDHATPWWPTRPDDPAGTTDLDNVGPLCSTTNRAKEAAGWRVRQTAAGVRTWHHPRSGLTTTTVPSSWRPPDHRDRRGPPGRAGPGRPRAPADRGRADPPARAPDRTPAAEDRATGSAAGATAGTTAGSPPPGEPPLPF